LIGAGYGSPAPIGGNGRSWRIGNANTLDFAVSPEEVAEFITALLMAAAVAVPNDPPG
jgi:hypothetical protein